MNMRVHIDCTGCESKIKKALEILDGVDDINIDMAMQKVTVTGWVDPKKVLKTVRKTGRKAEFWQYPYSPQYHDFAYRYYRNQFQNGSTHNYKKHGCDSHEYGYYPLQCYSSVLNDDGGNDHHIFVLVL